MQAGEYLLRSFRQFTRAGMLLCGVMMAALWPAVAAAQPVPEEVLQAWRRRQELVKTARFKFESDGEDRQSASTPLVSYRLPNVFVLGEEKWRHETRRLDDEEVVSTFDGRLGMRMFEGRQGTILRDPVNNDIRYLQLQPLVHWFRPLDLSFHGGADLSQCELLSSHEIVDGRPCIHLRAPPEGSDTSLRQFLYVDPAKDYAVVRCDSDVDERRSIQIDITYAEDPNVGWVPSAWKTVWWFGTGEVMSRYSSTVENYSINEKLSEKLFVIDFSPGTLVIDQASNITYRVGQDGEKDVVQPQKRPAVTKPAMPPPSAEELKKAKLWTDWMARGTLFVAIAALVALCVAALVRSRRRTA